MYFTVHAACQAFEVGALVIGHRAGDVHIYQDHLVAAPVASQMGNSFVAHPKDLSGLRSGRDLQQGRAIHSRHFDICSKSCLRDIDADIQQNIIPLAAEVFMRLYFDADIDMPLRATIDSRLSLFG